MGPNPIGLVSIYEDETWTQEETLGHTLTQKRPCEDTTRELPSASQPKRPQGKPNL